MAFYSTVRLILFSILKLLFAISIALAEIQEILEPDRLQKWLAPSKGLIGIVVKRHYLFVNLIVETVNL